MPGVNPIVGSFKPERFQSPEKRLNSTIVLAAFSANRSDGLRWEFDVVGYGAKRRRGIGRCTAARCDGKRAALAGDGALCKRVAVKRVAGARQPGR